MIPINNKDKLFYAILLLFILVKVFIAFQFHSVTWDESVYVGMGKHIYSNAQSGLWEVIRPPGLPILIGLIWKINQNPFLFEMLSLLFAVLTLIATYAISKKVFNESVGLFSILLIIGSPIFFKQSSLFMTEVPSTFFALAGLYFMIKDKFAVAGIFAAFSALFKFPHFMLFVVLLAAVLLRIHTASNLRTRIKTLLVLLPYVSIILAFLIVNSFAYSNSVFSITSAFEPILFAAQHQSNPAESLSSHLENIFFYPLVLFKENIFFIMLFVGVFCAIKQPSIRKQAALLLGYVLVYVAYFTAIVNKQDRFILLVLPIMAIFSGYGLYRMLLWGKGTTRFGTVFTILIFVLAALQSYSIVNEHKDYVNSRMHSQHNYDYSFLKGQILTSNPLVAYYTDHKVVPYYFSTADSKNGIARAVKRYDQNKNVSIIIFDNAGFYCTNYDEYCEKQHQKILKESNGSIIFY